MSQERGEERTTSFPGIKGKSPGNEVGGEKNCHQYGKKYEQYTKDSPIN